SVVPLGTAVSTFSLHDALPICHAQGERDYSRAAAMVDAAAQPALLGEALNGRGVTRSMLGRFEEALEDLGRARVLLARSGDMLSDRKSTRLNSSHVKISYAVFC